MHKSSEERLWVQGSLQAVMQLEALAARLSELNRGQMVIAPKLCNKLGLLPGWKPPSRG